MKKLRLILCVLFIFSLTAGVLTVSAETASAKTKRVLACKVVKNKLTFRKSAFVSSYLGPQADWENIIGYGKKKTLKFSKKAKFYFFDYSTGSMNSYKRTTRKRFIRFLNSHKAQKYRDFGKTYYFGVACKITVKNGKITKIKQVYQEAY